MKHIALTLALFSSLSFFSQERLKNCELFIPNSLSLSSEYWKIISECKLKKFKISVYNKWGQLIQNSDSLSKNGVGPWKSDTPQGIYVYTIVYSFEKDSLNSKKASGNLTVVH